MRHQAAAEKNDGRPAGGDLAPDSAVIQQKLCSLHESRRGLESHLA